MTAKSEYHSLKLNGETVQLERHVWRGNPDPDAPRRAIPQAVPPPPKPDRLPPPCNDKPFGPVEKVMQAGWDLFRRTWMAKKSRRGRGMTVRRILDKQPTGAHDPSVECLHCLGVANDLHDKVEKICQDCYDNNQCVDCEQLSFPHHNTEPGGIVYFRQTRRCFVCTEIRATHGPMERTCRDAEKPPQYQLIGRITIVPMIGPKTVDIKTWAPTSNT
jgi:hypothetical protein